MRSSRQETQEWVIVVIQSGPVDDDVHVTVVYVQEYTATTGVVGLNSQVTSDVSFLERKYPQSQRHWSMFVYVCLHGRDATHSA